MLEELRNGFMEQSGLTESKATAWWDKMEREQRIHIESYSSRGGSGGAGGNEVSYVSSLIVEKNKTDALLYQLLPKVYADRIKQGAKRIADHHECVSVLFADICGFTQMSSTVTADTVVDMLDELFHEFDVLTEKMGMILSIFMYMFMSGIVSCLLATGWIWNEYSCMHVFLWK